MRTNTLISIAVIAAAFTFASCEKDEVFTVNTRTPQRTEFKQRTLPSSFTVGANKPASVEAVDLGLSVKWANMNIGATSEMELGDLYAWGEITPSKNYGWFNYEHNDFHSNDEKTLYLTKYCFDKYGEKQDLQSGGVNLDKFDDAASMQWGEDWRMPTFEEVKELVEKCTYDYDADTDIITITGPNGNSMSIPFSLVVVGVSTDVFTEMESSAVIPGCFWSSTLDTYNSFDAAFFTMFLERKDGKWIVVPYAEPRMNRCFGLPIRPVYNGK